MRVGKGVYLATADGRAFCIRFYDKTEWWYMFELPLTEVPWLPKDHDSRPIRKNLLMSQKRSNYLGRRRTYSACRKYVEGFAWKKVMETLA